MDSDFLHISLINLAIVLCEAWAVAMMVSAEENRLVIRIFSLTIFGWNSLLQFNVLGAWPSLVAVILNFIAWRWMLHGKLISLMLKEPDPEANRAERMEGKVYGWNPRLFKALGLLVLLIFSFLLQR